MLHLRWSGNLKILKGTRMNRIEELRKKLILRTKKSVTEKFSEKEVGAIKAVSTIDDLDTTFNLLAEHVLDWYSIHFPELSRIVSESETQLKLISHLGERKNFEEKQIFEHYANEKKASEIAGAAKNSLGAELEKKEVDEIKLLALNTLNLKEERKFLTKFLEEKMNKIAPSFSGLAGPSLAAKFLARMGSLKRLAMAPSTTIQVLGAEKALFSHLRNKTKPPKHGYLYSHPMLKQANRKQKGKIAKMLAAKLSIAAKADYFEQKNISAQLRKELDQKVLKLGLCRINL